MFPSPLPLLFPSHLPTLPPILFCTTLGGAARAAPHRDGADQNGGGGGRRDRHHRAGPRLFGQRRCQRCGWRQPLGNGHVHAVHGRGHPTDGLPDPFARADPPARRQPPVWGRLPRAVGSVASRGRRHPTARVGSVCRCELPQCIS